MGVYRRKQQLWFRFKAPDGKWCNARSGYAVGQEKLAQRAFKKLVERVAAGVELTGERSAPLTVREYADRWEVNRRKFVESHEDGDAGRLRLHVLPRIGSMPIDEVRPRHLAKMFRDLRAAKDPLAPKSIHNIYGVVRALFRDAAIDGLIDATPCILDKSVLGANVDSKLEWRESAVYSRDELELLTSSPLVPFDRRVMYALEGIGAMRHGEAAGLRWRHYDAAAPGLAKLTIATSYDKGRTKTNVARYMPVHPVLAALLAEWKLSGWPEMMGRKPERDDLICPCPKPTNRGPRRPHGAMRDDGYSWKRLAKDLEALGLRHRRGHDLRRTMISLARGDGANKDILRRGTHKPPREVIEGYTTFEWDVLCREVAKLQLGRSARGQLLTLPTGVSPMTEPFDPRYTLVTPADEAPEITSETAWRRRESKPRPTAPASAVDPTSTAVSLGKRAANGEASPVDLRRNDPTCNGVTSSPPRKPWRSPAVVSAVIRRAGR